MVFIFHPAFALRHIGPGADIGQPLGNGVDIAVGAVNPLNIARQPVIGHMSRFMDKPEDAGQQPGMFGRRDTAEIGDAANIPQQTHAGGGAAGRRNLWQIRQSLQRQHIIRIAHPGQPVVAGLGLQRPDQPGD